MKTYEKRTAERTAMSAMKAKEKEMKDEKEDERQVWSHQGDSLLLDSFWVY